MQKKSVINYIHKLIKNLPSDWVNLTTHRLDIYNESLAKTQFLEHFENLYENDIYDTAALENLPTAYDYIRLGHPLSCVLEWTIAKLNHIDAEQVISFDSKIIPVLAILRTNLLQNKSTTLYYKDDIDAVFKSQILEDIYNYSFKLQRIESLDSIETSEDTSVYISNIENFDELRLNANIDFVVNNYGNHGSVLIVNSNDKKSDIKAIQHVRRRETVAMTPINTLEILKSVATNSKIKNKSISISNEKDDVKQLIKNITHTSVEPIVASSGLSMQYAIMMGAIEYAQINYSNKDIKFIVPTNCYGGTNDQARRVATCKPNVEIVDLQVDGDNDMVNSLKTVLDKIALEDSVPFIIAEIPTNPRVEVPNLNELKATLSKSRITKDGKEAISPVFILDQTFCPNINFLGEGRVLSEIKALSYSSGSKFPSGGKCTAGYCVANDIAKYLQNKIKTHLLLCDNEATDDQYKILKEQLPSMLERIEDAYKNTREFVTYIEDILPDAKINFVSEKLAEQGFTPSVLSLDLPTKGNTDLERENYKRKLNNRLINLMITKIPEESKYCVSYGQLKGCYWTIPATSTQGTTKESDKDYIARVALSGNMDLEKHKAVFKQFADSI